MECRLERHLFLSPHYDDIPLSCGGTAALLSSRGHRPEILLIFGNYPNPAEPLTDFARSLHSRWGFDAAEVIDARRKEEAVASSLIGATDIYLPFHDAIYRGDSYTSDDQLFAAPVESESHLPFDIVEALGLAESEESTTFFYAPLAIGAHVDHQVVFQVGVILHQRGFSVRFYEDLPYALNPDARERRLSARDQPVEIAEGVPVEEVWETKIDAIMAYPSQLHVIFREYVGIEPTRDRISEEMLSYAKAAGDGVAVERFWKLADA